MRAIVEGSLLGVLVALVATYFVSTSRYVRRWMFLAVCSLGAIVGLYGFAVSYFGVRNNLVRFLGQVLKFRAGTGASPEALPTGYFALLEIPLSVIIGVSLCFGILFLEDVFTRRQLRRWVYPGLAAYFVIWIVLSVGTEFLFYFGTYSAVEKDASLVLDITFSFTLFLITRGGALLLLLAFAVSASCGFRLKLFQALFPLACLLFLVSIVSDGLRRPMPVEELFFLNLWWLFWLMAYFYLNAKYHEERIKSPLVKRIPKTGIFMVGIGVLHEFPQYEKYRALFPTTSLATEYVLITLDLSLLLTLGALVLSDRVFRAADGLEAGDPRSSGAR